MRRLFNWIRNLKTKRKLLLGSVGFLALVAVGIFSPRFVQAGAGDEITIFIIEHLMFPILQFLANLLVVVINILISVAQYNDFINAEAVLKGWVIVRDLCNMFFIIVLLVIAFGTLLKLEQYRYNRLLGKLIIYAFLINFSKFIAGFWIDIGQVIMLTFVNGFKNAAAGNLASGLGLAEMVTLAKQAPDVKSTGLMIAVLLGIALLIIAVIVVVIMLAILLFRILMLWFLVVTSPLAFITRVFPGTAKYSDQWWGEFNKYIIVGPVLAFFLWLALTVIAVTGANPPSGFPDISTREGDSVLNAELPGGTAAVGVIAERTLSVTITEISKSDRILTFMITIGMLMGALQAAQQLGVAGGKLAGTWSEKIRKGGVTAAGVLSGVAAARLAMRGAREGGKIIGGAAWRKAVMWKPGGKQPLAYFSKHLWGGWAERGKERQAEAESELHGKGKELSETVIKGWMSGEPKAVRRYREEAIKGNINKGVRSFREAVGDDPSTEKLVHEMITAGETGGDEGRFYRAGALITAANKGNVDDWNQTIVRKELKDAKRDPVTRDILQEEKDRIVAKYDMDSWNDFLEESESHQRAMMMNYLQIDRSKFDPHKIARDKGVDLKTAEGMALENARKASTNDQDKLAAFEWASNVVLERGLHVEQRHGGYDPETGRAFVMSGEQSYENIRGLVQKKGLQEISSNITPHVIAFRYFDEKGKMHINTDADNWTELGKRFIDFIGQMTGRELTRMAPRVAGQVIGDVKQVGEKDAIFDEHGDYYEGAGTKEERAKRRAESEALWKKQVEVNADAARKLYTLRYHKTGEFREEVPGIGKDDKWKEWLKTKEAEATHGAKPTGPSRVPSVPIDQRVPQEEADQSRLESMDDKAAEFQRQASRLPGTAQELNTALDSLTHSFDDLSKRMDSIANQLTHPEAKKEMQSLMKDVQDHMQVSQDRPQFFGADSAFKAEYFKKSENLLREIEKAIRNTTKQKAGFDQAGQTPATSAEREEEEEPPQTQPGKFE